MPWKVETMSEINSGRKGKTHLPTQLLLMLGRLSLNFLIELIPPGTKLTVKIESKDPLDIYGRTLAYVYLPDGRCVNEIHSSQKAMQSPIAVIIVVNLQTIKY